MMVQSLVYKQAGLGAKAEEDSDSLIVLERIFQNFGAQLDKALNCVLGWFSCMLGMRRRE